MLYHRKDEDKTFDVKEIYRWIQVKKKNNNIRLYSTQALKV